VSGVFDGGKTVATGRVSAWTGSTGSPGNGASATGGITFNRDATLNGTSAPVPKPTAAGTNYSWLKNLGIEITAGDSTSINNRRLHRLTALPTGIVMFYSIMNNVAGSYVAPASAATDNGTTNESVPGGFTAMPASATVYDNTSETASASATIPNGDWIRVGVGVSGNYAGGAGTPALPTIRLTWDENP
jgi:hypothetical protein